MSILYGSDGETGNIAANCGYSRYDDALLLIISELKYEIYFIVYG